MKTTKFSLAQYRDERIVELVKKTDQLTVAVWAIDCVKRVMPYFDENYPEDDRPRIAIETLQSWITTGIFKMSVIRGVSLASHTAARDIEEENSARSVARAAGQAVATAHVPTHSIGAAIYALQAVYRASTSRDAALAVTRERDWQYHRLLDLIKLKSYAPFP